MAKLSLRSLALWSLAFYFGAGVLLSILVFFQILVPAELFAVLPYVLLSAGVIISSVFLIYRVVPRWLLIFAWMNVIAYLLFLLTADLLPGALPFLIFPLFVLLVIFLARWFLDTRAIWRFSRSLDPATREKVKEIQARVAQGGRGAAAPRQPEAAPGGTELALGDQVVSDVQTLEGMTNLLVLEERVGLGETREVLIEQIHEVVVQLAKNSRRDYHRSTALAIFTFSLGVLISLALGA